MPRPRLRTEPCDCLDCREPTAASGIATSAATAAAQQEPPPKSVVLCLSGVLQSASSLQEAELPHMDALVLGGWAGLMACRAGGPSLPLQLLGIRQAGLPPPAGLLPDRFKQLRAVLLTDSTEAAQAGALAGCYAVHQLRGSGTSGPMWQPAAQLATHIAKLLHVQPQREAAAAATAAPALAAVLAAAQPEPVAQGGEEDEEGDDVIDMLILALDARHALPPATDTGKNGYGTAPQSSHNSRSCESSSSLTLEWADSLLRHLNQVPGFRDTVLLSLVLGSGQELFSHQPLLQDRQPLLSLQQLPIAPTAATTVSAAQASSNEEKVVAAAADFPAVRRPLQSYQIAGLERVAVDVHHPAVVVHRLPGVIRVDRAAALDLTHIVENGAAGCVLAECLLPEVAYKLGRAAKYGA